MKTSIARGRLPLLLVLTIAALFTLDVSLALAQGENSAVSKTDKWDYTALKKVPEKARAKRNPLENDPDAVAAGGKLFEQHCAECHGMKAEGGKKGGESARRRSTAGNTRRALLDFDERGCPAWHARMVQAARAGALADCHVSQDIQSFGTSTIIYRP